MSDAGLPFLPREFADRGTQWLLSHPAHLRHLLRILLGPECDRIDYTRLRLEPSRLLSEGLRKREADLVFTAPYRAPDEGEVAIFVLMEHQSTVSPAIRFRVLWYMLQLWDRQRQQWERQGRTEAAWQFHAILPVVYYTGERPWEQPLGLEALVAAPAALQRFVPQVELLFLPLRHVAPEQLLVEETAFGHLLRVMQLGHRPLAVLEQQLAEAVERIGALTTDDQAEWRGLLYFLLLFLWHERDPAEYGPLEQVVQTHQQDRARREEIETMGKTIVQHFIEEGQVRGRAEGRAEGRQEVLLRLLQTKFGALSPAAEERLRARTTEELDALAVRLLHAQSLEELGL